MITAPTGVYPILITPFMQDNTIDWDALGRLIDFYKRQPVVGLFVLGQGGEVLALTNEERWQVAEFVAQQARGHLFTVAVGNFGNTLEEQAASLAKVHALGIDIPLVGLSLLPEPTGLDHQLLAVAMNVPDLPLGICELPEPEHRLLSAEQVARVAHSGRYFFMKDTCRQVEPFTAKVQAAQGTPLKVYQANLKILPESMQVGSAGFCGWAAIVAPERCQQLIDVEGTPEPVRSAVYQELMALHEMLVAQDFPASAKFMLAQRGVAMQPHSRVQRKGTFGTENAAALDHFLNAAERFARWAE